MKSSFVDAESSECPWGGVMQVCRRGSKGQRFMVGDRSRAAGPL